MSTCLLITTYNRSALLERSLERFALTLPDEILVVDDGGDDGCEQACERVAYKLARPVRYLYTHNPGISLCSHARNVGIRNTDAEIVITSEPEIVFVSDVVRQLLEHHRKCPENVITAGSVERERETPAIGWVAPFTALYERQWLLDVGGWDEQMPGNYAFDDTDLLTRLRHTGHGQCIDLDIRVRHQWHEKNMTPQQINDGYFRGKSYHRGDPTDIVANRGVEWGRIKTR